MPRASFPHFTDEIPVLGRKERGFVEGQTVLHSKTGPINLITPIQHSFYHSIDYRKYGNSTITTHLGKKKSITNTQ